MVDMSITIDELSGLTGQEGEMFMAKWKRGSGFQGVTRWAKVENGAVNWKHNFQVSGVALPREQFDQNKKFLEFSFFKQRKPNDEEAFGSVKVEIFFQNEKRKKASLQFTLAQPDNPASAQRLKLIITVQMTETTSGSHSLPTSPAETFTRPSSPKSKSAPRGATVQDAAYAPHLEPPVIYDSRVSDRYSQPFRSPLSELRVGPVDFDYRGQGTDFSRDLLGVDGSAPSLENMKLNVLKLYAKVQDTESRLGEKKREVREARSAFSNLKNDYEHLRSDLDNAEQRCQRLRDDLSREQNMNRELMELKAKLEHFSRNGYDDTNRGCDIGHCVVQ